MYGDAGEGIIYGAVGSDTISGGDGNAYIGGGGGKGSDIFAFDRNDGQIFINDFR